MKPTKRNRIVIGVDEGLPSRVAASILRNQDFDLAAVHLYCDLAAIGEDPATYPSAMRTSDLPAIEKFCESLGVPLKTIDVTGELLSKVYTPFLLATLGGARFDGSAGWQREVLFPQLESVAQARGAQMLATGHFAKYAGDLFRYSSEAVDQSRSLARLGRKLLEKLTLPVGDVTIEMMMRLAREIGIAEKVEGGRDDERELRIVLEARRKRGQWEWTDEQLSNPSVQARVGLDFFKLGPIRPAEEEGDKGEHRGIPFFQIGSPLPEVPEYFVREIIPQTHTLIVATELKLGTTSIIVRDLNWSERDRRDSHRRHRVTVARERSGKRVASIGPDQVEGWILEYPSGRAEIRLESPFYALARGEALIFFEETRILGSAVAVECSYEKKIEIVEAQA